MQSVYKQLALGWRIVKQRSGLDPILPSNNKRTELQFFLWNKRKTVSKTAIYQNSAISEALLRKI